MEIQSQMNMDAGWLAHWLAHWLDCTTRLKFASLPAASIQTLQQWIYSISQSMQQSLQYEIIFSKRT
jgi:predicted alpha/beta hydrolase family esterase